MKRAEACGVLHELAACWKERNGSDSELIVVAIHSMGMEFGLRFTLNYPEYAVALRDALDNCESEGDGSKQRFLNAAADIIASHPIEVRP
jgi:hypothetical protein